MTPTDALIEKMARGIHTKSPKRDQRMAVQWDELPADWKAAFIDTARAAYEAEHEEMKG